jgi:hypothetical protein
MRLSDILSQSNGGGNIRDAWNNSTVAADFEPLPPGEYVARIVSGEIKKSRRNSTPGFSMTFEVIEPAEYAKRKFWHDCWLTPAAMPQTKRDLGKLGVTSLEQLENPLPRFIRCKCKLARRRDDDGNETNRLKSFDVLGIDPPDVDPFAPVAVPLVDPPGLDGAAVALSIPNDPAANPTTPIPF